MQENKVIQNFNDQFDADLLYNYYCGTEIYVKIQWMIYILVCMGTIYHALIYTKFFSPLHNIILC